MNILLIEPDVVLNKIYKSGLEYYGYKVYIAQDAQSAISIADANDIDLIVMELQLPNHNGIEFLYEFRSYIEWQDIPVIVQSAIYPNELENNQVFWEDLNISKYLYKPRTSINNLVSCIKKVSKTSVKNK